MTDHDHQQQVAGRLQLALGEFSLNADFQFPSQGVTALFGPSGSGKSTLLRIIAGFERKARGEFRLGDECWMSSEINLPTHQRPVGYVFQEASLLPHLSVEKNLLFGYRRVPKQERRLHPDAVIERLGLEPLLSRAPHHLSGGERQRVAIGRALLTSPRLLLMDEPLSALDRQSKADILPYLEGLRSALAIPILYVSHSHEEVARLADHLLIMREGRIVDQGPINELVNKINSTVSAADERFALLDCQLERQLPAYQLSRLSLGSNAHLLVPMVDAQPGQALRVRVQARDVSLCLSQAQDSSILNILPVELSQANEPVGGQRLVLLTCDGGQLLARISDMSYQKLRLHPGQRLYAQIKSAALLNQP